jgi:type 1 glutamine amidotransferase
LVAAPQVALARQQPPVGARPAPPGGGGGPVGALLRALDADKDGSLTAPEVKGGFDKWYAAGGGTDAAGADATQLASGINASLPAEAECGGRSPTPRVPCPNDVEAMLLALPDKAPATPKKPRKVLVLSATRGFVHSSIPLLARTMEEMGRKTGAFAATTTYDAADVNTKTLAQYDAIVLNNTTGFFLDEPGPDADHEARKAALLAFIRGGKGIAAIHAASDSYHGDPATARTGPPPGAGLGSMLAPMLVSRADKDGDGRLTRAEMAALSESWFSTISAGAPSVTIADAGPRLMNAGLSPANRGPSAGPPPNAGLWPEWNRIVGGWFKWHWNDPQPIVVKIDDPKNPINAPFKGQSFEIRDETYTFPMDSWSRDNVRVLLSVDYAKMSEADKAKEPAATRRTDGDYGLSWVRREGQGRLFYAAHGHSERVYTIRPMLEHYLAGIQYAVGDLQADDAPRPKAD